MTKDHPCNCGQSLLDSGDVTALDTIPPLDELEAALDATMGEDLLGAAELDLALATNELTPEEELAFAALEDTSAPSLDTIINVLERYPGLKVTLSY